MRFLYIGSNDVFTRHKLGFIASLTELGKVDVVVLGSRIRAEKLSIASDNGVYTINLYEVPCGGKLFFFKRCATIASQLLIQGDYSIVFATPRLPILVAQSMGASKVVVLRLWSIRAAKLRDNLRFGAYEDIMLFMPSVIANMYYILRSTYSIVVDHATYTFAKRFYPFVKDRIARIYRGASLVVVPITNRSISNRLLEALFYGKPIVTSEIVKPLHPELEHGKHVFISTWDTIVEDVTKILKDEKILKSLEQGAQQAYSKYFSTRHNVMVLRRLLK